METPTTLAAWLEASSGNPKYDEACKRALSEKLILAWILKHTVKEYASVSIPDIASKYIVGNPEVSEIPVLPDETNVSRITGVGVEDSTITEGTITYDIRFSAMIPNERTAISIIINVEAQNDYYPGYPLIKRALYYCGRLISAQKDTVFTKSNYEKIQKVYSIWICMNPPKEREYTITEYSFSEKNILGEVKEKIEYYDLAAAVMICLGNPKDGRQNKLIDMLNTLLGTDATKEEKKQRLSDDFDIQVTGQLEQEVDEMCNLSIGIERRGIEKGIEKGIEQSTIDHIKNLMDTLHLTAEAAMNALKVSKEDQQRYITMI